MVKGFGVLVQVKGEGTLMWKIEDDDGVIHPINIKKALYVPESPSCLLSPQKWAQQANINYPKPDSTWCATKSCHCTLYWDQERYRRTIPWDSAANVAIILSSPSTNYHQVFVVAYEQEQ